MKIESPKVKDEKKKTPTPKKDNEKTSTEFKLEAVTSKPSRKYKKGSKYDILLDTFIKSPAKLSKVTIAGVKANYIASQLNKRLVIRQLTKTLDISVANDEAYIEKIESKPAPAPAQKPAF